MPGLIGKKIGMTSLFTDDGKNIPCTVIEAGPCVVTQVKTRDKDGYEAVQLAFGEIKEKSCTKPLLGHFKKAKITPRKKMVEFKGFKEDLKPGDVLTVDFLKDDTWLDISGISKGKGFQGVVKRHGFSGVGEASHGQHDRERAPGSIGSSSDPSRVFKGMRMAGRTGGERVMMISLRVVKIIPEKNILIVQGSVPGANGSYLTIEQ